MRLRGWQGAAADGPGVSGGGRPDWRRRRRCRRGSRPVRTRCGRTHPRAAAGPRRARARPSASTRSSAVSGAKQTFVVAGLIAQTRRHDDRRRVATCRRDVELHADHELALEDRERLVRRRACLKSIGVGENNLRDRDARRARSKVSDRGNEQRVARLVGLNVQPFGQRHLERGAGRAAAGARRRVRSAVSAWRRGRRPAHARSPQKRATTEDTTDTEERSCLTSLTLRVLGVLRGSVASVTSPL